MNGHDAMPGWGVRWGPLVRKEVREILRDRRTILTLVLMPLLLYPLLTTAFKMFVASGAAASPQDYVYLLGFRTEDEYKRVMTLLLLGEADLAGIDVAELNDPVKRSELDARVMKHFRPVYPDGGKGPYDVEKMLQTKEVHLAFRLQPARPRGRGEVSAPDVCEILYLEGSVTGGEALSLVQARLAAGNLSIVERQVRGRLRLPADDRLQARSVELPDPEHKSAFSLAALVPLILVLMTITGAVYPAIDLTAGERERGTLEMLIAAPVPRVRLLLAKYVAVVAVAVLTALMNITMMTLSVLVSGLGPTLFGPQGVTPELVAEVLGLLLLFALFFSAVLLAITSFARSFKEAQAYLIPLMLAAIAPGVLALMPSVKLTLPLAVVPLVNVVILSRDLFEGTAAALPAAVVVLTTLLYAAAAVHLAARIFGAEAVLFRDQGGLAEVFRRPGEPRPAASAPGALLALALVFVLQFLINGALGQQDELSFGTKLVLITSATTMLYAGLPLVLAAWGRVNPRTGFGMRAAPWPAYPAAALLGVALVPLVAELAVLLVQSGLVSESAQVREQASKMLAEWQQHSPILLVLAIAVVPPVAEELLFRGYLFGALAQRLRPAQTIITTALAFGLFHILALGWVRVVVSALLGLVLGWVRWRTGSLWPGMVLHAAVNGSLVCAALRPDLAGPLAGEGKDHIPLPWLAGATIAAVVAVAVLNWRRREPQGG